MQSKIVFNTVLSLMARQPWISEKQYELSHMLFDECKCDRTREMVINIISSFFYMSTEKYYQSLEAIAHEVIEEKFLDTDTQIVAMAADSNPDSSHEILYNLKFIFTKLGWKDFKGTSSFGAAYKTYNRHGHKNILVVDDFVGSGQTVISRHTELAKVFANANVKDVKILFKVLVATERGLEAVRSAGIAISAQHTIKKAIDDCYSDDIAQEYRALMIELESILSKEYKGTPMPSLGYNGAQAAYCRERANSPNSVFPVFWWPFTNTHEDRKTILHRAMGDA